MEVLVPSLVLLGGVGPSRRSLGLRDMSLKETVELWSLLSFCFPAIR